SYQQDLPPIVVPGLPDDPVPPILLATPTAIPSPTVVPTPRLESTPTPPALATVCPNPFNTCKQKVAADYRTAVATFQVGQLAAQAAPLTAQATSQAEIANVNATVQADYLA